MGPSLTIIIDQAAIALATVGKLFPQRHLFLQHVANYILRSEKKYMKGPIRKAERGNLTPTIFRKWDQ